MARKYYVYDHWEHDWCNTWCYETGERGISKTIAILIGYIFEKQK